MKKNLLMFTAAGFSQAYLRYDNKSLSTSTINETLSDSLLFSKHYNDIYSEEPSENILRVQKLFSKIWTSLNNNEIYDNKLYPPNFETVFYVLNFILQMQNPDKIINEQDFTHKSFFLPKLVSSVKSDWDVDFSIMDFYQFKNFLLSYISKFTAQESDLKKIYNFITTLKNKFKLRYYTLNYDNLFLKAVEGVADEFSDSQIPEDINFGFDFEYNIVASEIFSNEKYHCCFHLHGSVNYGIDLHTCSFHESENEAFESRNKYIQQELHTGEVGDWSAIIVGYDKEKNLNLEPYSSFYLRMGLDLLEADELIIMGYGLSDEHINKYLLKLSTLIAAPDYQCDEVKENVERSRFIKLNKITIVDFLQDPDHQKEYSKKFLTIARSTGERNLADGYRELNYKIIGNNNYEFYFEGVDSFIVQYLLDKRV